MAGNSLRRRDQGNSDPTPYYGSGRHPEDQYKQDQQSTLWSSREAREKKEAARLAKIEKNKRITDRLKKGRRAFKDFKGYVKGGGGNTSAQKTALRGHFEQVRAKRQRMQAKIG